MKKYKVLTPFGDMKVGEELEKWSEHTYRYSYPRGYRAGTSFEYIAPNEILMMEKLGIIEEVKDTRYSASIVSMTDKEIRENTSVVMPQPDVRASVVKEDEFPKEGDWFWSIFPEGFVRNDTWDGDGIDHARKNFLGVFKTKEEAIEASKKMLDALK